MKVKAALPKTGEVVPIEIAAERAGTYTISCSVYCGSGHSRMRARLVVTPAKRAQGETKR
jgi:heme/copper-type cytochrome/quinol oxidase subunit 2